MVALPFLQAVLPLQVKKISELVRTSTAPLPAPPPSSQPEEELPETLPYEVTEPMEDEPDISEIQQQPNDDAP